MKEPAPAALNPDDALIFVGETLNITCSADFQGTVSHARFLITTDTDKRILPPENQTKFGDSGIQTQLRITDDLSSSTSVSCLDDEVSLETIKLYVERPLKDVSNLSVVFLDDSYQHVYLSWSSNSEYYKKPDHVKTEVLYWYGSKPDWENGTLACDQDLESCDAFGFQGQSHFTVQFTVEHLSSSMRPGPDYLRPLFNTTLKSEHTFELAEIRKTGPVTDVRVRDIGKTCVNLTWALPIYFAKRCHHCPELRYQISLTRTDDKRFLIVSRTCFVDCKVAKSQASEMMLNNFQFQLIST
ncbi:hypothetical protein ElyMa_001424600 [Elysia marginata]|uniref:Ig-like domain-containing protein n=1 Tax=Elysia marginata TaxID=1093978 RepID=A0AAV4IZ52_9GAST|nr:hypothetical protein ElyMa_001424600 [Elysia marginata]